MIYFNEIYEVASINIIFEIIRTILKTDDKKDVLLKKKTSTFEQLLIVMKCYYMQIFKVNNCNNLK